MSLEQRKKLRAQDVVYRSIKRTLPSKVGPIKISEKVRRFSARTVSLLPFNGDTSDLVEAKQKERRIRRIEEREGIVNTIARSIGVATIVQRDTIALGEATPNIFGEQNIQWWDGQPERKWWRVKTTLKRDCWIEPEEILFQAINLATEKGYLQKVEGNLEEKIRRDFKLYKSGKAHYVAVELDDIKIVVGRKTRDDSWGNVQIMTEETPEIKKQNMLSDIRKAVTLENVTEKICETWETANKATCVELGHTIVGPTGFPFEEMEEISDRDISTCICGQEEHGGYVRVITKEDLADLTNDYLIDNIEQSDLIFRPRKTESDQPDYILTVTKKEDIVKVRAVLASDELKKVDERLKQQFVRDITDKLPTKNSERRQVALKKVRGYVQGYIVGQMGKKYGPEKSFNLSTKIALGHALSKIGLDEKGQEFLCSQPNTGLREVVLGVFLDLDLDLPPEIKYFLYQALQGGGALERGGVKWVPDDISFTVLNK